MVGGNWYGSISVPLAYTSQFVLESPRLTEREKPAENAEVPIALKSGHYSVTIVPSDNRVYQRFRCQGEGFSLLSVLFPSPLPIRLNLSSC
jgi:hypothetical protein